MKMKFDPYFGHGTLSKTHTCVHDKSHDYIHMTNVTSKIAHQSFSNNKRALVIRPIKRLLKDWPGIMCEGSTGT